MTKVCRFDKGQIKGKATKTDEGYIRANAIVTRTGVFLYKNSDGSIRRELRHPDDVFAADSMESLQMIPITNGHPEEVLVNSDNAKELTIGQTGEKVSVDGQHLMASMVITHKDGVEAVNMGRKELSLGYNLDLEEVSGEYNGEPYDCRQRNISYNHLAIVDRARAGGAASLNLDAGDALQIDSLTTNEPKTKPTKETPMKKVTLDGIDYDAAPEVANALAKANARADAAEGTLKETTVALDEQKAATSKVEAERDELKEKAATNSDQATIQAAVKERIDLERVASKVLSAEDFAKVNGDTSDAEIKAQVIMAKNPNANLDGKDEVYVQARFDAVVELIGNDKTAADQRESMNERNDGSKQEDADAKRDASFDGLKNMHKAKSEK